MMEVTTGAARHVLDERRVLDLARAAFAAQLAHRLDVERPALHVGVGEMAAVGVGRKRAAELEPAVRRRTARSRPAWQKPKPSSENSTVGEKLS